MCLKDLRKKQRKQVCLRYSELPELIRLQCSIANNEHTSVPQGGVYMKLKITDVVQMCAISGYKRNVRISRKSG